MFLLAERKRKEEGFVGDGGPSVAQTYKGGRGGGQRAGPEGGGGGAVWEEHEETTTEQKRSGEAETPEDAEARGSKRQVESAMGRAGQGRASHRKMLSRKSSSCWEATKSMMRRTKPAQLCNLLKHSTRLVKLPRPLGCITPQIQKLGHQKQTYPRQAR